MRSICFSFVIIILSSCIQKSNKGNLENFPLINIDLLSEADSEFKKVSDIAEKVEYIQLETTAISLMGSKTRKIVYRDANLYLLNSSELLCFNNDGRFLFKLENVGRGPQEYTTINDFDISSDNKTLLILSPGKILVFSIEDSSFIFQKSISLGSPNPYKLGIIPKTDNVFLAIPPWGGSEPILSLMINLDGDTIYYKENCYKYNIIRKLNTIATNEMQVYSIGDKVCFKEEFSDTVFYADAIDNSFKPKLILDSHGTLYTPEMRGGSEVGDKTQFIASIFETSRYVFFWHGTNKSRYRIVFDKIRRTKHLLRTNNNNRSTLKDDIFGSLDFDIEFIYHYCSDDRLFSFIDPLAFKAYINSEDFRNANVNETKTKEAIKMADSLDETDNPLLVIITLKE